MDMESYESFYKRIKDSLMLCNDTSKKAFKASQISSALTDCNSCVSKGLELATKLVEETNIQVNKLCDYIDNAITLLQIVSDLIKNVLESAAMACCNMKPFPTTTGNIILTVFIHCKDSEWIYGNHLKSVETQLKDLFRTCHELQLTYLMTLEKHFIFDLSEKEEQDILIEALNINMRIGEIVQALDIKTMAEQWKAYIALCEKYSNFLLDKNIYNKCSQLFTKIITDNIKIAMESDQNNKSILRSLKVSNFTIKILTRFSNVFKHAVTNNYEHVVELMEYIYMHSPAVLGWSSGISQQFIHLTSTDILNATDALCNTLLQDERFLDCLYNIDVTKLEMNPLLGYIILTTSITKAVVQKKEDQILDVAKRKLIHCVYRILPLGHYWFNVGLQFSIKIGTSSKSYITLYEYLLVHTLALASTFTEQQYVVLEKYMYESIMSTDCYSAMFSSNLWVLLARISNDNLASNTLSSLLSIYQKLENHRQFHNSPQQVHLSFTIEKLFQVCSSEEKRLMSKQIQPQNSLWSILKVANLPDPLRRNIESDVLKHLKTGFHEVFDSKDVSGKEIDNLIQIIKIAATCSFIESDIIEQYAVRLWLKLCLKNHYIGCEDFGTSDTEWCFKYMEALVSLTDRIRIKLNSASLAKILHSMSTLLHNCNTDIIVLLYDLFCNLTFNRVEDENHNVIENIFKEVTDQLLQCGDVCIKQYLLSTLSNYIYNERYQDVVTALCDDELLRKGLDQFNSKSRIDNWKYELQTVNNSEYKHKCLKITSNVYENHSEGIISNKSNFDLGDFLFDDESEGPSRKRAKLELDETDSLVERLENDTLLLCQVEHSALQNYKKRITNVVNKLRNIVS